MNIELLLYIVLFSQIIFLSYYYPKRMLIRVHTIFENYLPNQFINHLMIGLGIGLILWFYVTPRTRKWDQAIIF